MAHAWYCPKDGGTIKIDVEEEKDRYLVGIADTGTGISEQNLNKIFNPFFSTKDKGSGLGLPIVKNIIEAHRGKLRIKSNVDVGTEVLIILPKEQ